MFRREAVILAGGLGTRLRETTGDHPKSMVPVNGVPFLAYILEQLCKYRFAKVILAVGFLHEEIIAFFGDKYKGLSLQYSIEKEPLGTGGALLKAAGLIAADTFLVFNGDTLYDVDLEDFRRSFQYSNASLSIALKPMKNFDRYGSVTLDENRIVQFNEKRFCEDGLINGGVYVIRKSWFLSIVPSERFSLEKDLMERNVAHDLITGYISDSYFIDIGVPEDYERALRELPGIR
jgi:D-glycero-alpha-D-manno-heptose 1-phosphate guanylyltransferase